MKINTIDTRKASASDVFASVSWIKLAVLSFFAITLFLCLPLPPVMLSFLSPIRFHKITTAWNLTESHTVWESISYISGNALTWWVFLLSLLLFFTVLQDLFKDRKTLKIVVFIMIGIGLLESVYGLIQALTPSLGVLWVEYIEDYMGTARGTFINRNNFSGPNLPIEYNKYKHDWETVDSLISVGLPKSALELVESIYDEAKAQNNAPQFIKASIYKLKLKADFEEEFIETTVADLKAEIEIAQSPTKQILHSILADIYWRYYQANRYKFLERTATTNPDFDDIQTWDLKTLLDAVIKNYSASLDNKDLLHQANLRDYDVILETATESKKYRPTLYDFLAHRAADFFMNDESSLTEPAYHFEIDKKEYFGSIKDFVNLSMETKDSLSLKFYALVILQDLVAFHLNDKDPTALIDANLKRLIFVYQNTTLENKDELYISNFENFEKEYNNSSASTDISFHIANHYFREGKKYNPIRSDDHKWEIKKAADKCREAVSKFPESDGAVNCQVLFEKIETKQIQLTIDDVNLPEHPFLGLLGFKNISHIYFRIVKISFEKNQEFEGRYRNQKETLKRYIDLNSYKAWDMELPNDGDY